MRTGTGAVAEQAYTPLVKDAGSGKTRWLWKVRSSHIRHSSFLLRTLILTTGYCSSFAATPLGEFELLFFHPKCTGITIFMPYFLFKVIRSSCIRYTPL
jgi:hypothetical protein